MRMCQITLNNGAAPEDAGHNQYMLCAAVTANVRRYLVGGGVDRRDSVRTRIRHIGVETRRRRDRCRNNADPNRDAWTAATTLLVAVAITETLAEEKLVT